MRAYTPSSAMLKLRSSTPPKIGVRSQRGGASVAVMDGDGIRAIAPLRVKSLIVSRRRDLGHRLVDVVQLGAERPRHHTLHQVQRKGVGELQELLVAALLLESCG